MSKVTGPQDFSGQDGYEEVASEAVADAPELSGVVQKKFVPTIDDPTVRKATSTVYQSGDLRLHEANSPPRGKRFQR